MPNLCVRTGGTVSPNDASGRGFCMVADMRVAGFLICLDTEAKRQPRAGIDGEPAPTQGMKLALASPARAGPAGWATGWG